MRRSERWTAVAGAVLIVAASAAALAALTVHGAATRDVVAADDRVPEDLFWPWVLSCQGGATTPIVNVTYDPQGAVDLTVAVLDPDAPYGTPLLDERGDAIVDEEASRAIEECLSTRRLEVPARYRPASPAERLLIYDWAVRWQAPCLDARGFVVDVPPVDGFVGPDQVPWFLLSNRDWFAEEYDFDAVLAARHACEPVPPFLAADGVGW